MERPRECIVMRERKQGTGTGSAALSAAKRQLASWPAELENGPQRR